MIEKPADPDPSEGEAQATEGEADGEGGRMSLLEHLNELRVRLRNAAIVFLVSLIAAFIYSDKIFVWLTAPIQAAMRRKDIEVVINYFSITEPFWVYLKLSIVAGIFVAAPLIFWQIWQFVAPGLYRGEKKVALTVTGATAVCFVGGAIFGYALLAETAAFYLLGVPVPVPGQVDIKPVLDMEKVSNFQTMLLLGCGVAFELPVVLAVLGGLGLVTARGLWSFNKYALILCAIVGGILTPGPDVVSQLLLAGPLFGLYNVSILVVWAIQRAQRRKQEDTEAAAQDG